MAYAFAVAIISRWQSNDLMKLLGCFNCLFASTVHVWDSPWVSAQCWFDQEWVDMSSECARMPTHGCVSCLRLQDRFSVISQLIQCRLSAANLAQSHWCQMSNMLLARLRSQSHLSSWLPTSSGLCFFCLPTSLVGGKHYSMWYCPTFWCESFPANYKNPLAVVLHHFWRVCKHWRIPWHRSQLECYDVFHNQIFSCTWTKIPVKEKQNAHLISENRRWRPGSTTICLL